MQKLRLRKMLDVGVSTSAFLLCLVEGSSSISYRFKVFATFTSAQLKFGSGLVKCQRLGVLIPYHTSEDRGCSLHSRYHGLYDYEMLFGEQASYHHTLGFVRL